MVGGTSNSIRGIVKEVVAVATIDNKCIDFVTIQSTGNATDFGDLTTLRAMYYATLWFLMLMED